MKAELTNRKWLQATHTASMLVALSLPFAGWTTTRYVDLNNANPTPPYTNWEAAATVIQDAVDAAKPEDLILVKDGAYQTGGRVAAESDTPTTNRVAVLKPLTLQSVNGPAVTIIQGYQVPETTNGDAAVRCVYLTNGAVLAGFTLMGGATGTNGNPWDGLMRRWPSANGGGVLCESGSAIISNCVITGNSAFIQGGGVDQGTLLNCTISSNITQYYGGGVAGDYYSRLESKPTCLLANCTLVANTARLWPSARGYGGGAFSSVLVSCVVNGNIGGGALNCSLTNCVVLDNQGRGASGEAIYCTFSGNTAGGAAGYLESCIVTGNSCPDDGGGGASGTLLNCIITNNSALLGGGICDAKAINCLLAGNLASSFGGGAWGGTLYSCTVVGNSAGADGGGAYSSSLYNCIVYYNTSPENDNYNAYGDGLVLNSCCTTPMPTNGIGNITLPPLFIDLASRNLRLQSNSPCINAGDSCYTTFNFPFPSPLLTVTNDLDGNPRISGANLDIGAYEWQAPAPLPPPALSIRLLASRVVLSWPASAANYGLEVSTNLALDTPWTGIAEGIVISDSNFVFEQHPEAAAAFYRLRKK